MLPYACDHDVSGKIKITDLGSRRQGHLQPVRSAILATAGLFASLDGGLSSVGHGCVVAKR